MVLSDHRSCNPHHNHHSVGQQSQQRQNGSTYNHVNNYYSTKPQKLPLWRAVVVFSACAIALIMTVTAYLGCLPSFRHYFHVNYYYRSTTVTVSQQDEYAQNVPNYTSTRVELATASKQISTASTPAPTEHSYTTSDIIPVGSVVRAKKDAELENDSIEAAADGSNNINATVLPSPALQSSTSTISTVHQSNSSSVSSLPSSPTSCDLFQGEWVHEPNLQGPYYNDSSCPILTQSQNCQGNGRPDKDYEKWRWRPQGCDLPLFDAREFLRLMEGKTIGFVGDSVARNQMESLMCILWQVEVPVNRGSRKMQKWLFRSHKVTVIRIWSAWLVRTNHDTTEDVTKLYLEEADPNFMEFLPRMDVVVVSSGHWFTKRSAYVVQSAGSQVVVGGQLWKPPRNYNLKSKSMMKNPQAFGIAMKTALGGIVKSGYSGLAILRTYSPDHYEGGTWNTGGSCTGKTRPLMPHELVRNPYTDVLYSHQLRAFNKYYKYNNNTKLRLLDITPVFAYRADGHPGPYRNRDPNKITQRGPRGQPPPQDCLHWCMPGPIDTWNELLLQMLRQELPSSSIYTSTN